MKIQLTTSPHVRHPAVLQADFRPEQSVMITFIPVGLLSLIASVRETVRLEPRLFDLNRRIVDGTIVLGPKFYEAAAEMLCAGDPDLIGFMTESDSYHHVLQMCAQIKRIHPTCIVVLGGPHASAVARVTLEKNSYVDYIVQGEGEITFSELVHAYAQGNRQPVPGSMGRNAEGAVVLGGPRPQISSLDLLPYPA